MLYAEKVSVVEIVMAAAKKSDTTFFIASFFLMFDSSYTNVMYIYSVISYLSEALINIL